MHTLCKRKSIILITSIKECFMAKKIRSESGSIYCSYCGTSVDEDDKSCSNCGESLESEVVEGRVCHACGSPVGRMADTCPKCGISLVDVGSGKSEEDDYLSKLLGWGDETEEVLKEKIEEKQKALNIFKKVTGAEGEEVKSGLEVEEIERLEEPFKKVLIVTTNLLEDVDKKIKVLEERLEEEESEEIFEEIKMLRIEKDHLESLEEGINYMSNAVEAVIDKQQEEIERKQEELTERVQEFKKVVKKKEEEKSTIQEEKGNLQNKEKELKMWEIQLKAWEDDIKEKEKRLNDLKGNYEEGEKKLEQIENDLPEGKITPEEWREEQRKIQQELFQLKDMWEEGEEGIQDIDEITSDNITILKNTLKKKEEKWKQKIDELEYELEELRKERDSIHSEGSLVGIKIDEVGVVLSVLDKLLGELPEERIEKFAKSKYFKKYEKLMDALGL